MARKSVLLPEELYNNIQKMEVSSFGIPLNMSMAKKIDFLYFYYNVEQVQSETEEEFKKNNPNYIVDLSKINDLKKHAWERFPKITDKMTKEICD